MRTFIVLLQKEFLQIRRNSFRLIIAFPILIMLIMPLIMTMDVRNVNVAVVDLDRSTTSQRIASHIEASEYLRLTHSTTEYPLAMDALEQGLVDVIVQIPDHFERDLMVSTPERISITANAVNATKGGMCRPSLGHSQNCVEKRVPQNCRSWLLSKTVITRHSITAII